MALKNWKNERRNISLVSARSVRISTEWFDRSIDPPSEDLKEKKENQNGRQSDAADNKGGWIDAMYIPAR